MSRRIRTTALQSLNGSAAPDTYFDRIVKYVPADVVAAWTAVGAAVEGAKKAAIAIPADNILWGCLVFGAIFTPLWVNKQTYEPGKPRAWTQIIVATLAFIVWVFALGAPFNSLPFYNGVYGTLAIFGFTLVSGLIIPKDPPPAPIVPNQP